MKLNENYLLREIAGSPVVVAVGEEAAKLNGMITLNTTGAFIWKLLEKGEERSAILCALATEYAGVSAEILEKDLDTFLEKLKKQGILTD